MMADFKLNITVPDGPHCDGCKFIRGHQPLIGDSYYTCGLFLENINHHAATLEDWHLFKCYECAFRSDGDVFIKTVAELKMYREKVNSLTEALHNANLRLEKCGGSGDDNFGIQ